MSCFIIAEAGVNHNGSLQTAFELVDCATECGADAIKFQTFKASRLVATNTAMASYQEQNLGQSGSQLDMLRSLELSMDDFLKIQQHCQKRKIYFMTTAFDTESLHQVVKYFPLPYIKISSGDLVDAPLLLAAASHQLPILLSCGMADIPEIETALSVLAYGFTKTPDTPPSLAAFRTSWQNPAGRKMVSSLVTLLQCTTSYPAPFSDINLRAMKTLEQTFNVQTGFSDHTQGIEASITACALGAKVIEKHITLSKDMQGPDHIASTEPDEFKKMIRSIRNVEAALGVSNKQISSSEKNNRLPARKSLRAITHIKKGQIITEEDIQIIRPGNGNTPFAYWDIIGTPASQSYPPDTPLNEPIPALPTNAS
ncbi:N-acetylneuraminate synthase [Terasakiella sp.]|uniref:N-acetylneuraminate synthase n=1 Tax=Terasakiella sp. TaxID=2034861 RepID=UPI003AA8B2D7